MPELENSDERASRNSSNSTPPKYLSCKEQIELLRQLYSSLLTSFMLLKMIGVFEISMTIFFFALFLYRMPPVHVEQVPGRDWLGRRQVSPPSADGWGTLNDSASVGTAASYFAYLKELEEAFKDKQEGKWNGTEGVDKRAKQAELQMLSSFHGFHGLLGRETRLVSTAGRIALLMSAVLLLWGAYNIFRAHLSLRKSIQRVTEQPLASSSRLDRVAATSTSPPPSNKLDLRNGKDEIPSPPPPKSTDTSPAISNPSDSALPDGIENANTKEKEEDARTPWDTSYCGQLVLRHQRLIASFSVWPTVYWLLALQRYNRDKYVEMEAAGLLPPKLYLGITDRPLDLLLAVWQPIFHMIVLWMISAISVSRNDLALLYELRYDVDGKSL